VIVVRSYPRTLKHVEAFLNSITHKATKQVLIEAKILEVTLSDEYKSGIYWEMLKKKFKFSSFGGDPSNMYNVQQLSASEQGMSSSVISAKLNLKPDFQSVIQALSIQGKVSVLSSPKIAALNNQRALIKFGDDSYFITNVTTTTLSSSTAANNASQQGFSMTPYFSGIALDTTPSIMNNNDIILHIHPMISTVVAETKEITISGLSSKVPSAKIQTRETDTVVKAQSGDIIVIGGLMQSTVKQTESGLPSPGGVLSKIFSTFAAKQKSAEKIELVILMRPTISPGWTHSEEEFSKYLSNNTKPAPNEEVALEK
jgi:MSHA biogenesis protein MshL